MAANEDARPRDIDPVIARPRSVMLPGADTLTPREQGSYDGLCGLYAIVNALTLALHPHVPLTSAQTYALFTTGLTTLEKAYMLHGAMLSGLPIKLWERTLDDLCAAAATMTGVTVDFEYAFTFAPRFTRAGMFAELEEAIDDGRPIVLPLEGALSHYTVVSGYTPTSIRLFDSAGLRWFKRASCGIDPLDRRYRHRLDVAHARAIRVTLPDAG